MKNRIKERMLNGGRKPSFDSNPEDQKRMLIELYDFVADEGIIHYHVLLDVLYQNKLFDYLEVAIDRAFFFNVLFTSIRDELSDEELSDIEEIQALLPYYMGVQ